MLAWIGFTTIHQVAPREQAIVTTLGKYSRTFNPCLNFSLPWPIERVEVENVSGIRL